VDISGYGEEGPYREMKAYDLLVQCESGLASVTGSPAEPGRVGVSICDIACGMAAHAAILEALIERSQTGKGKGLHVSLFDAVADWMTVPLLHQEYSGQAPPRVGISHASIAPYGAFDSKDGSQVVIAVQNSREWAAFCNDVLENPALAASALYRTNVDRCNNRASMDAAINDVFSTLSRAEIQDRLRKAGIAYASVNDLLALSQHPQLRRSTVQSPSGSVELVSPPAVSEGEQVELRPVPALGQHGNSIREEFSHE
jgi:crotonobetainyl-CoA:carnitine CoA-transferase CaiB-like acyl-CoA transferase